MTRIRETLGLVACSILKAEARRRALHDNSFLEPDDQIMTLKVTLHPRSLLLSFLADRSRPFLLIWGFLFVTSQPSRSILS